MFELTILRRLLGLVLAAASSALSLSSLSPVYGSIPASLYHTQIVALILLLACLLCLFVPARPTPLPEHWLPVLAFWIPTSQFYLFKLSDRLGPVIGPIVTQVLTVYPLVLLAATAVQRPRSDSRQREQWPSVTWALQLGLIPLFSVLEKLAFSFFRSLSLHVPAVFSAAFQLLVAFGYACLSPSRLLLLAVPALLHSALFNVHMPFAHTSAALNRDLYAAHGHTVLARRQSVTGYLSVVESLERGYRALRCDHSLLGGEWLSPKRGSSAPVAARVRDPIYAVFVMLEAVRLIEPTTPLPDHIKRLLPPKDGTQDALVMWVEQSPSSWLERRVRRARKSEGRLGSADILSGGAEASESARLQPHSWRMGLGRQPSRLIPWCTSMPRHTLAWVRTILR